MCCKYAKGVGREGHRHPGKGEGDRGDRERITMVIAKIGMIEVKVMLKVRGRVR